MGAALTPEICQQIELAARSKPFCPIDTAQFAPQSYQGYTLQAERFVAVKDELHPLHEAHWLETEKHRHGLALRPDYQALIDDDRAGTLAQFTARTADGQLAGHVRMYLGLSRHTSTPFGEEDTLYLRPEFRGGFLAVALMRYAERAMQRLGAREIRADSKLMNGADVLMRRLGYQPVALLFHKHLKD